MENSIKVCPHCQTINEPDYICPDAVGRPFPDRRPTPSLSRQAPPPVTDLSQAMLLQPAMGRRAELTAILCRRLSTACRQIRLTLLSVTIQG